MPQKSNESPKQAPRPQQAPRPATVPSRKEGGSLGHTTPKPTEVRGTGPRSPKTGK